MNHLRAGKKLERNRNGRRALVRSLVEALVLNGKIRTTEARAKEIKSRIDRVLNAAREANTAPEGARRVAVVRLLKKRYSALTLARLSDPAFVQRLGERTSGHARVVKLPPRRGDGARMAFLELVEKTV